MKADAAQSFSGGQITGKHRSFIREQKYALLLSHRKNLKPKARKGLKELLVANRRLNTAAYILKESFKPAIDEYGCNFPPKQDARHRYGRRGRNSLIPFDQGSVEAGSPIGRKISFS